MAAFDILNSFVLGLLTPLTAACVLPLYPGFLSYIASRFSETDDRKIYALTGLLAALGVLAFMALIGLVFTTVLQTSLTGVIQVVSPIAFSILGIISIFLILDIEFSSVFPHIDTPTSDNPLLDAFGFFFGVIVIPCNPAFIAIFFTRAFLFQNFASSILNFFAFGFGIGFPLLAFSLASANWSKQVIGFLTRHRTAINRTAGIIMLGISIYYLVFVFSIV